jgi:hypothetical protein
MRVNEVHLVEATPDDITWKFTNLGSYTGRLAGPNLKA